MPFVIFCLASGPTRIALEGDLDLFTVERLRPELLTVVRRRPAAVEIDLSRLRSLSTRGMQALGVFFANLAEIDCLITVTEMRDQVLGVDTSSLLDGILDASRLVN